MSSKAQLSDASLREVLEKGRNVEVFSATGGRRITSDDLIYEILRLRGEQRFLERRVAADLDELEERVRRLEERLPGE